MLGFLFFRRKTIGADQLSCNHRCGAYRIACPPTPHVPYQSRGGAVDMLALLPAAASLARLASDSCDVKLIAAVSGTTCVLGTDFGCGVRASNGTITPNSTQMWMFSNTVGCSGVFECNANKVPCGGTKGSNSWNEPHNCDCRGTLWHEDKPAFKGCATGLSRSLPYCDATRSHAARVAWLVGNLSLAEKIGASLQRQRSGTAAGITPQESSGWTCRSTTG